MMTAMLEKLKARASALQTEVHALYIASRDPRTPWYAKALAFLVVAYVLSPIDLIPDFIPVFGYLDDILIASAGIALVLKMIPASVMNDARKTAIKDQDQFSMLSKFGTAIVIVIWILITAWLIWRLYLLLSKIRR